MGAALYSEDAAECTLEELIQRLVNSQATDLQPSDTLPPLFNSAEDLADFRERHAQAQATEKPLSQHTGVTFLGIDAGSTTTKVTLIDEDGHLLFLLW